jgi:hypothetical protein
MSRIDEIMRVFDLDEPTYAEMRDLIAADIADARREEAIEAQQRMFPCCGGNDESPAEHTMDCETRSMPTSSRQAVRLTDLMSVDAARFVGWVYRNP